MPDLFLYHIRLTVIIKYHKGSQPVRVIASYFCRIYNLKSIEHSVLGYFLHYNFRFSSACRLKRMGLSRCRNSATFLTTLLQTNSMVCPPRMNRILDASHGGNRAELMLAVASYNAMPTRAHGISPEAIWRACRPLESRWKHKNVLEVLGEDKVELTAAEWDDYLAAHAALTTEDYKQAVQAFEKRLRPVQEAIQDQHARSALARTLGYQRKKTQASAMPVLSGDRVLVRASQYRSSCGHAKFETDKDGGLKEFVVESITSSIAKLKQTGTDAEVLKHVAMLKVLPNSLPAGSADDPGPSPRAQKEMANLPVLGPFSQIAAKDDGACLFRALAMGLQSLSGVPAHRLHDSDEQSLQLRRTLVGYSERYVQGLPNAEVLRLAEHVATELQDDPSWHGHFTWHLFHDFMLQPHRFGTYYMIATFARMHRIGVSVYRLENDALQLSWDEQVPETDGAPDHRITLLRTGMHFDLLVQTDSAEPVAKRRRIRGKQTEKA